MIQKRGLLFHSEKKIHFHDTEHSEFSVYYMVWEVSHANTAHLCNSLKLLPFNGNRIFMRTFQSSFLKLKFAKAASKLARNTFDCIYSGLLWFLDISQNYIVIVLRPFSSRRLHSLIIHLWPRSPFSLKKNNALSRQTQ